ncbi:unnamed protein product [Brachionus calyciflorus]|uniref:Uncharacterized protein n=1 Tax=Brachionus calyciflorus TaxID=104777 RepID=A0A814AAH3_9BILA|nr:unnamed protein product [Brachionus calyciflorus]
MDFVFPISKKDLENICQNSYKDKCNQNTLHLTGDYIKNFENAQRIDTVFLRTNGYCKDCIEKNAKYWFIIKNVDKNVNPSKEEQNLETLEVESGAKSSFVNKRFQITGDDRIKIAEEIILYHNGSASAYILYKKSKNEPVAEVDVYKKLYHN